MIKFDNKKVLITGSSNGLGKKIVETFFENNSSGFGFDLKKSNNELKGWEFFKLDVADEKEIIGGFDKIKEKTENLDVVVANAGVVPPWKNIFCHLQFNQEVDNNTMYLLV